jgi:hypothetical protein
MARRLNPGNDEIFKHRIQCVKCVRPHLFKFTGIMTITRDVSSVWRPLKGPVRDWPLALCHPQSLEVDRDLEPCDLVYPDY